MSSLHAGLKPSQHSLRRSFCRKGSLRRSTSSTYNSTRLARQQLAIARSLGIPRRHSRRGFRSTR